MIAANGKAIGLDEALIGRATAVPAGIVRLALAGPHKPVPRAAVRSGRFKVAEAAIRADLLTVKRLRRCNHCRK